MEAGASPWQEVLQEAARIKGAMLEQDRRRFDALPDFLKRTLFQGGHAAHARALPFPQRLAAAQQLRQEGNALFRQEQPEQCATALSKYVDALGAFWYCSSRDPDWRRLGIKDEHLEVVDWTGEEASEQDSALQHKLACLLNIAACHLALRDFALCVEACDHALQLDPHNVKALYRRAKARTTPAHAGATEVDMAIRDLALAHKLQPGNADVARRLQQLRAERAHQAKRDRTTFADMFSRGAVYEDHERSASEEAPSAARPLDRLRDLAAAYRREGREDDAAVIEREVERVERQPAPTVDFAQASPDMLEEARRLG